MAFPTTSVLDSFNRDDEGPPPSANWTTPSGWSGMYVSSNQVKGSGTSSAATWSAGTFGPDCEIYITLNTNFQFGWDLFTRCSSINFDASGGNTFYDLYIYWSGGAGGNWVAQFYKNATYTTIGSAQNLSIGVGDSVGYSVIGDTLTLYEKVSGVWSEVYSFTDSSVTGAGYLAIDTASSSILLDDFGGGTISTGSNPSVSDSISVSESYSLSISGATPDLLLSTSGSITVSESYAVFNTGSLPYSVSDSIHVSEFADAYVSRMPAISGTINGNQIQGYVRSLRRVAHLCNPGQHATLIMSPDWPHGSAPGKMVFLYEDGLQIMKGFVIRSVKSRPSHEWVIEIDDTYTLVVSTFLDVPEVTTAGHDTAYWASYILEKCGADFNINGTPAMVPEGVQIGLRPASEALKDILA